MHWVALHFPKFRQQALSRGHARPDPEPEALEAVASWACQFTPRVSLEPPHELLLEVAGSLRYFGGRWKFLARLRAGLTALGFEARLAEAPTARAALWLVRGEGRQLELLPVTVTGLGQEPLELLAGLGVKTLGRLLRLPRDGIVRRFGEALLNELDQARGAASEARNFYVPPARFSVRLETSTPVWQAEGALFMIKRMLEQMEAFLAVRHAGVRCFSVELEHRKIASTRLEFGLASAVRDEKHLVRLARERLGALQLRAPIEAVRLSAERLEFLPGHSGRLLRDTQSDGEDRLRLIERLQSRLGYDAVHGLRSHPEHRPELAFHEVPADAQKQEPVDPPPGPRPLWLVEPPRRLKENEFALLAGPERIDSGWSAGSEANRDYFIARTGEASLAWIYREREGGWFLHGLFA